MKRESFGSKYEFNQEWNAIMNLIKFGEGVKDVHERQQKLFTDIFITSKIQLINTCLTSLSFFSSVPTTANDTTLHLFQLFFPFNRESQIKIAQL